MGLETKVELSLIGHRLVLTASDMVSDGLGAITSSPLSNAATDRAQGSPKVQELVMFLAFFRIDLMESLGCLGVIGCESAVETVSFPRA